MWVADAVDWLLELSIVGSFSRIGIAVRRRLGGWTDPPGDTLIGRTVLITGPTSGLGRQATDELAALGARIVLVGRSEERLEEVRDELVARHGDDRYPIVVADLGSLESVRAGIERVLSTEDRLDVVIDNAGAIFAERSESPDGIESTLAVLVVGPFALVAGLMPLLRRTDGARVLAVTSGGMYTQPLHLDDLEWRNEDYSGTRAYARAKRAQVMLIREWARRTSGGVTFTAMHPGWADTPGLSASLPGFSGVMRPILRSPSEGIDSLVWLAAAPVDPAFDGALVHDRRARPLDRIPTTRASAEERRELWQRIVALARIEDPAPDG
jgi:dehydrogenase/reductase SDR family member 12